MPSAKEHISATHLTLLRRKTKDNVFHSMCTEMDGSYSTKYVVDECCLVEHCLYLYDKTIFQIQILKLCNKSWDE